MYTIVILSVVVSDPVVGQFYTTPLWIGKGCAPPECCSHSGMPWFCKTLPVPTTDYIEIRNCYNDPVGDEDTALDLIELYIHQLVATSHMNKGANYMHAQLDKIGSYSCLVRNKTYASIIL